MTWNPINWTAAPFLTLYCGLMIIVFTVAFKQRSTIGPLDMPAHNLAVVELAYLADGANRLGDTLLLCLTAKNGVTISRSGKITVSDQSPLDDLIADPPHITFQPNLTRQQFQNAIKPLVELIEARLQTMGYSPSDRQMETFRFGILPNIGLLLLLGAVKIYVGAERQHEVGLLLFLIMLTIMLGCAVSSRPLRTQMGDRVLKAYQRSNARAARAPLEGEWLLAVALSGAIVLSGTEYASVYAASKTMSDPSGGCGGGGGGGGGCGGCS